MTPPIIPTIKRKLSLTDTLNILSKFYGMASRDITGPSRMTHLVRSRFAFIMLTQHFTLQAVGVALRRHHTTIMSGRVQARQLIQYDTAFATEVASLRALIHDAEQSPKKKDLVRE